MRDNPTEVIVGGVVLAAAIGFFVYASQATGFGQASGGGYTLQANFRSAEGVAVGTDIRLAGVSIGAVSGLQLNPEPYRAETLMSIEAGVRIPDDSSVAVATEGLLGGTYVEIIPGGSWEYFAQGDLIEDTQGAISIVQLLVKFAAGGTEDDVGAATP